MNSQKDNAINFCSVQNRGRKIEYKWYKNVKHELIVVAYGYRLFFVWIYNGITYL